MYYSTSRSECKSQSRTAVVGAFIVALSGSVAYAGTQCYDFSGPAPDTVYQIGQTVNARHSVIHLQQLMTENGPMNPGDAKIENTPLPAGASAGLRNSASGHASGAPKAGASSDV